MKRETSLLKNTLILSVGTVLPKAVSFLVLPILTAYLTKEEYGYYDLITTAVTLFLPVVTLQIQVAAFRYLIDCREKEQDRNRIVTNIIFFTLVSSVVALMILFFALFKLPITIRIAICLYFFTDIIMNTTRQITRGIGRNKVYADSVLVESLVYLMGIFCLVWYGKQGLIGSLYALTLSLILAVGFIIYKINLFDFIDFNLLDRTLLKELLRYSWPMIPNSLSNWVIRLSDRWVISAFLGVEATAIYAVATKFPTIYSRLQSTFTLAWQENASIALKDEDSETYYSNMFDMMYCIFFSIMAILIALTPILFKVLIQGDYETAYYQIPILYIASFFSSVSAYLGGIYIAYKETKKVGITTMVAAVINLLVNVLLIETIGIYAGAVSTLVSYMVLAVFRMYDIQKIQKLHFNIKKILLIISVLVIMALISYQRNIIFDVVNFVIAIMFSFMFNGKIFKKILEKIIK